MIRRSRGTYATHPSMVLIYRMRSRQWVEIDQLLLLGENDGENE
jgi:hypothetical protein